jgi:sarcosine oxidase subunit beta
MKAEIVIVGAGVMGASIAFQLAKRNAGRVVVLDKDTVGQGASGRSSALVRMHYAFAPEVQLALRSLKIFQNWQGLVGERGAFRKTGFVQLVPRREIELLHANVRMQKECGVNVELISCDELRKLEPEWNLDDEPGVAYEPDSGYGDGSVVANDFLAAARKLGVDYRPKTEVKRLLASDGKITGVETGNGTIQAPMVVVTTGQWTRGLLQTVGADLPIETELHYVAILRNAEDMRGGGVACIDSASTMYFRPDGQEKMLVGDFYGKRGVDPENFPRHVEPDWYEDIVARAARRMPRLQNAEIMKGITGVYDVSPDARPILGEIASVRGLHVAAGFTGMGFKLSPAIGIVLSELLLDGVAKTVDITAFRPSRFAEGKLIKPEFEYQDA